MVAVPEQKHGHVIIRVTASQTGKDGPEMEATLDRNQVKNRELRIKKNLKINESLMIPLVQSDNILDIPENGLLLVEDVHGNVTTGLHLI